MINMAKFVENIDGVINVNAGLNSVYTIEGGLYGFTPSDMSTSRPDHNDRTYLSIFYLSSAHERFDLQTKNAWQSRLTIGVLGLDVFSSLQRNIHESTGSDPARGWGNQISDGGELTVRYQLSNKSAINIEMPGMDADFSQQLSVGYITEVSVAISARMGVLGSNWWYFNPELTSYGEQRSGNYGNYGNYGKKESHFSLPESHQKFVHTMCFCRGNSVTDP
jgi:hypothetical protein